MAPIDDAIADFDLREPGDNFTLKTIAERYGVDRSTLGRRCKRLTGSRQDGYAQQQKLNPQQEEGLVDYIAALTARGLPPTRAMIQNFASNIAKQHVGRGWVTRFIHQNHDHLISKWSAGMDVVRHYADSQRKYELYFELLHHKIVQYDVQPHNTYNMDEKGFMIGITGRSKRVFSRLQWKSKKVRASLQDGSREWVTVIAAICADGSTLPPALIYSSANSTLQGSWVAAIEATKHDIFVSSSPTGWTNNDIGLAWLEQVFDRKTKQKARLGRDWRLLILDGHGSHLSMDFIEYCEAHKILLAVFPPHSTHTLQPLDVVCFKPLSTSYSTKLGDYLFKSQGLLAVQKGDFFLMFWSAWESSLTTKLVCKAFEATGICPMNADVVVQRFSNKDDDKSELRPSTLLPADWRQMDRLIRSGVKDTAAEDSRKLSRTLHQLQVQNEVLQHENNGLRDTLTAKKQRKAAGKPLSLQHEESYHGGATFWSPSKFERARERETEKQQRDEAEAAAKSSKRELQAAAKLLREQEKEERRVAREKAKEVRDQMKAEQVAARAARNKANNTRKLSTTALKGKRKALRAPSSSLKSKRPKGDAAAGASSSIAAPAAPPKVTTRGRNIVFPSKYR
jgi:hypothetical protein